MVRTRVSGTATLSEAEVMPPIRRILLWPAWDHWGDVWLPTRPRGLDAGDSVSKIPVNWAYVDFQVVR